MFDSFSFEKQPPKVIYFYALWIISKASCLLVFYHLITQIPLFK